jgi:hypothetical protein
MPADQVMIALFFLGCAAVLLVAVCTQGVRALTGEPTLFKKRTPLDWE